MSAFHQLLMAAATAGGAEQPIDGVTGVWLKSGGVTLSSGMSMTGALVTAGMSQFVYARGAASDTDVRAGGSMHVSSGGAAETLAVHGSGARAFVYRGGAALFPEIYSSGRMTVFGSDARVSKAHVRGPDGFLTVYGAGAYAEEITMSAGAYVYVYQNAVMADVLISAGNLYVSSAGTATRVLLTGAGGAATVYSSGVLTSATVGSGRRLIVTTGGNVSEATIESGGSLLISSGGTALAVTSNAGAVVDVLDGGYIEYA